MNCKKASTTVYLTFFLVMFLAFSAFAVDGAIVLTNRAKLQNATEMTAIAAAAEFSSVTPGTAVSQQQVIDTATNIFSLLQKDSLQTASINVSVKIAPDVTTSGKVLIKADMISQPYFLSFLGVTGVKLKAKACAQNEDLSVTSNYPGINWLTVSAAYLSDILSDDVNMSDTAILKPLGNFSSASYDKPTGFVNFGLISSEDHPQKPLSLGPGGFITIKLPSPIINKPGYDLFIKEAGTLDGIPKETLEGYMVFAGLDIDPDNPYVKWDKKGANIAWVNISCSGKPEITDTRGIVGAYIAPTGSTTLSNQAKFYGSGYFDLGANCIPKTISMAKYIRIIDDNSETAFVTSDTSNNTSKPYYQAMLYGEASTATSGADIDAVRILNNIRLIRPSDF